MWQQVYQQHRDDNVEVIAIACDVQGPTAVQPWVQKAGATFTTLIDTDNKLAAMFGFNFVPLTIWLNKDGTITRPPTGGDIHREKERQQLREWIENGQVSGEPTAPSPLTADQQNARLRVQFVSRLLNKNKKEQALTQLELAQQSDPKNWLIRKQIWAIKYPDRFYKGPIDYNWQRQQLKKEQGVKTEQAKSNATE